MKEEIFSFAVSFLLQKEFSFLFLKCNHTKWEKEKNSSGEIAGRKETCNI